MNIFVLDYNHKQNAIWHVDKHVVKMRLEIAQMLCTALHQVGLAADLIPYKATHVNHPASKFVRENRNNYKFALDLGFELCDELDYRFGAKEQKARNVLDRCSKYIDCFPDKPLTTPARAMPDEYKVEGNDLGSVIRSYRNYYNGAKLHLFKWTRRPQPDWILS